MHGVAERRLDYRTALTGLFDRKATVDHAHNARTNGAKHTILD